MFKIRGLVVYLGVFFVLTLTSCSIGTPRATATFASSQYCGDTYKLPWPHDLGEVEVKQGVEGEFSHFDEMAHAFDFMIGYGKKVLASRGGTVEFAVYTWANDHCGGQEYANEGNYVVVKHEDGTSELYLHLQHELQPIVKPGDIVTQGQLLGHVGMTGYTAGRTGDICTPHLHFQLQDRSTCNGSWFCQSIPIAFSEVDGCFPVEGNSYVSENILSQESVLAATVQNPGITPVATVVPIPTENFPTLIPAPTESENYKFVWLKGYWEGTAHIENTNPFTRYFQIKGDTPNTLRGYAIANDFSYEIEYSGLGDYGVCMTAYGGSGDSRFVFYKFCFQELSDDSLSYRGYDSMGNIEAGTVYRSDTPYPFDMLGQ